MTDCQLQTGGVAGHLRRDARTVIREDGIKDEPVGRILARVDSGDVEDLRPALEDRRGVLNAVAPIDEAAHASIASATWSARLSVRRSSSQSPRVSVMYSQYSPRAVISVSVVRS